MTDNRRGTFEMSSEQMQTALQIFGTADFEDEEELSEEADEALQDLGLEELKEVRHNAIKQLYEPSELAEKFATEADEKIRATDIPERFQIRMPNR